MPTEIEELATVLKNSSIGNFEVMVQTKTNSKELREGINLFCQGLAPNDHMFMYFGCHGDLDRDNKFTFIAKDTERDNIHVNGLPAAYVLGELNASQCSKQMIIVDACYSGAFPLEVIQATINNSMHGVKGGRFIITSTNSYTEAQDIRLSEQEIVRSPFTKIIINGLENGEASLDSSIITMLSLFGHIKKNKDQLEQDPVIDLANVTDYEMVLANNPSFQPASDLQSINTEQLAEIEQLRTSRDQTAETLNRFLNRLLILLEKTISPFLPDVLTDLGSTEPDAIMELSFEAKSSLRNQLEFIGDSCEFMTQKTSNWGVQKVIFLAANAWFYLDEMEISNEFYSMLEDVSPLQRGSETSFSLSLLHLNWGQVLGIQGRYDDAIAQFKKVIEINIMPGIAHHYIGVIYSRAARTTSFKHQLKFVERSMEEFKLAIRIGPIKSHWYYNWGVVLFDFGEMHLEVEKQDTTVHAHSGHYFRKAGEKFLMAINMEVHSNPKLVASIYNNWGYSLSGVGYHQAAIEKYLIAQEYDETVITYQNLGYSLSELEDYKEAMEIYKKIISIDHENVLTLLRYGEVLAKLNDHKVAISKFKHAAELKPKKWRLNQICNAWADSLGKQNIDPETDITYQRICVG